MHIHVNKEHSSTNCDAKVAIKSCIEMLASYTCFYVDP